MKRKSHATSIDKLQLINYINWCGSDGGGGGGGCDDDDEAKRCL